MPYIPTAPINDPTNPDAIPDLDDWGPDTYWEAADWITWHRAMVQKYGLDKANQAFVSYWQTQTFGAEPINARSFDESFRAYARANGFLDSLYSGSDVIAEPLGVVTDIFSGASNLSGSIPQLGAAAKNIVQTVAVAWPLIVIGAVLIYGQQAKKSAQTLFKP